MRFAVGQVQVAQVGGKKRFALHRQAGAREAGEGAEAIGAGVITGETSWASDCIKCRKCEKHCPQALPISSLMEEVGRKMEGPLVKAAMGAGRLFLGRTKSRS